MGERAGSWLALVRRLVEDVTRSDVTELELSQRDFRLRLRRRLTDVQTAGPVAEAAGSDAPDTLGVPVAAPFTGVFYRAPSPTAEPYVKEGDWIAAGTTIGLVETMKIFNEVKVDQAGRVLRVLVESGQLVHAGDPLLLLLPGERPDDAPTPS